MAAIVLGIAPGAHAAGAKMAPTATGSFERTFRHCSEERDPDLLTTTCMYSYFTESGFEDDPKTYWVEWLQIAVEPRSGWCVAGARGLARQSGSVVASRIPNPPSAAGLNSVRLPVMSHGRFVGAVKQQFLLLDGATSTSTRGWPNDNGYSWQWRGLSERKVLIVTGVAFARRPSDDEFVVTDQQTEVASVRC